jgi:hypothetical protein
MTRKVNVQDVDILFRLAELYNTDYDFQSVEWFWGRFHERTIEEYTSKYAPGSREYQFFERFTSRYEFAGLLVEKGMLNEDLFFARFGSLQAEWEKCKPIVYGLREKWNEPRHRENFELLAGRGKKWQAKHRPKV